MPAGAAAPAAARDSLVDVLLEFLEALVHQVLFVRELYAAELFQRQRLYGIAVRRSRHPELNAYISGVVGGLRVGAVRSRGARGLGRKGMVPGIQPMYSRNEGVKQRLGACCGPRLPHPNLCCRRARSPPALWPRLRCWC